MKTVAITFAALLLVAGAVPVALAQQDASPQQSAPPSAPPSAPADKAPDAKAQMPDAKAPDTKVDVNIKTDTGRSDEAGSASPRTDEAQRTGFFGLSPTAAIIVSVAVLLVVVLAIVAMTNNRSKTYIDRDRGL